MTDYKSQNHDRKKERKERKKKKRKKGRKEIKTIAFGNCKVRKHGTKLN